MDGWRGMLLDDVFPIGKGTPKLDSVSYWAHWAQSFLGKQVYCYRYNVFTSNIICGNFLNVWACENGWM